MKRFLFLAWCAMAIGVQAAQAQQAVLDDAIRAAADGLSAGIRSGSSVAVLAMESNSTGMSNYLINQTISALVGLQGGRGFAVVSRARLDQDLLAAELDFSMSGLVPDATAQRIGHFIGAQYVVTGSFEPLAGFFRFRMQLLEVETAAIRAIHTEDVRNDSFVMALLADGAIQSDAPGMFAARETFNHFAMSERFMTLGLNLVPGLGSFLVMGDTFGGVVQLLTTGTGFVLTIIGTRGDWETILYEWYLGIPAETSIYLVGVLLVATGVVFNGIRSFTFMRNAPAPRAASLPERWDVTFAPASGGGLGNVTFTHTLRF